ncbi:MAG: phytanoyl-CoA dioxygenase family protein [Pseudomonadota bacterium]
MTGQFSANAVQQFREQGYYFPYRLMPPEQAEALAARFMAFTESDAAKRYPRPVDQIYLLKVHLLFKWADEICHDAGLLDAVESLIGPDIMVWSSGVFWKGAHSGAHVSWHQDSTNYELDRAEGVVRAWVALTPATHENGTMHFMPGGHRLGQIKHNDMKAEGELLSRGETIDLKIDHEKTVPVLIEAGEVSFHHLHMPHGSGPNNSERPRVNYVITFINPEVAPRVGPDCATLVRGADRHRHYEHEPRPLQDFDPEATRAHEKFLVMRNAILFRGTELPPPPNHPIEARSSY